MFAAEQARSRFRPREHRGRVKPRANSAIKVQAFDLALNFFGITTRGVARLSAYCPKVELIRGNAYEMGINP
jgi:hypothetical protein